MASKRTIKKIFEAAKDVGMLPKEFDVKPFITPMTGGTLFQDEKKVQASNSAMGAGVKAKNSDINNDDMLDEEYKAIVNDLTIPSGYEWEYWVQINQYIDFEINRIKLIIGEENENSKDNNDKPTPKSNEGNPQDQPDADNLQETDGDATKSNAIPNNKDSGVDVKESANEAVEEDLAFAINGAWRNGDMFGTSCVTKIKGIWTACVVTDRIQAVNGKIISGKATPIKYAGFGQFKISDKLIKLDNSTKDAERAKANKEWMIEVTDKNAVFYEPRYNHIGDYIWILQQLALLIFYKRLCDCNAQQLLKHLQLNIKNARNAKEELKVAKNSRLPFYATFADGVSGISENEWKELGGKDHMNVPAIIEAYKFHKEEFYQLFGRPVSSMKDRQLDSDADMTNDSIEPIAEERLWRKRLFLKKLSKLTGVQCKLEEEEKAERQEPDNPNTETQLGEVNGAMGKNELKSKKAV